MPLGRHATPPDTARWALALVVVTVVFLLANHLLVRGIGVGRWDVDGQFHPFFTFVADHARAGRLVLWDPYSAGGLPALGEPQIGAFSPITILMGLLTGGSGQGFILYWLLLWWLGGVGMLALARHLGAPAWIGAIVALGFLFSGVYTGNAQHTSWIVGFSAIPFVVWRLDVAVTTGRALAATQAGAIWGLGALAAHPSIVILTGGMAILWAAGRAVDGGTDVRIRHDLPPPMAFGVRARQAAGAAALFVGVGLLVLSPTYFAFFHEGAGTHSRVGALTRAVALSNQFDPGALVTLATPWATSMAVSLRGGLFPTSDPSMTNIYMGLLIPVFALVALAGRGQRGWHWYLFALALLSLGAAMGEALPLRGWLYDLFLPLRYFRHSGVFRLYFVFFIAVLALIGGAEVARALAARDPRRLTPFLATTIVVAALATAATAWLVVDLWQAGVVGRRELIVAAGWVVLAALALGAWRMSDSRRGRVLPALLALLAIADAFGVSVIARPTITETGAAAERWRALDVRHDRSLDLRREGLVRVASTCADRTQRCRSNDQLIEKYQSFDSYTTQRHQVHLAMLQDPLLNTVGVGTDRVWFADSVATVPATAESFARFERRVRETGAIPLVVHEPASMLRPFTEAGGAMAGAVAALPPALPLSSALIAYEPNRLTLTVEAPRGGWVLVADRWARSWRARVNSAAVPMRGANFIFRAVPVRAGPNVIEFVFRPAYTLALVALSWTVLAVVGVLSLLDAARRRHRALPPPPAAA